MKHALERLDSLIIKRIDPSNIKKTHYSEEQLIYCLVAAGEDCDEIRIHLLQSVETIGDELQAKRVLQHYQSSLVHLLDTLSGYKAQKPGASLIKIYDAVSGTIRELLQYISKRFTIFFNLECKVPDIAQDIAIQGLRKEWEGVEQLLARHELKDELLKAASEPIRMFLGKKYSEKVTYRWMEYIKELLAQLNEWATTQFDDPEWELISLLMFLDLNSRKCRAYCIKYVSESMDNIFDPVARLHQLKLLNKKYRMVEVRPNTTFDSKHGPLIDHVLEWITTEIELVQKQVPAASPESKNDKANTENLITMIKKVISSLNVPELGAWIKSQMEAGAITNEEFKEVMEALAMVYETPHAANPSSNSMAKKAGELSVQSIKKMQRMARAMDAYFTAMLKG